nr:hypothetical protein Iba_scaffold41700CG0010 [Ipomoea batatas]
MSSPSTVACFDLPEIEEGAQGRRFPCYEPEGEEKNGGAKRDEDNRCLRRNCNRRSSLPSIRYNSDHHRCGCCLLVATGGAGSRPPSSPGRDVTIDFKRSTWLLLEWRM